MFSHRTDWSFALNPLMLRLKELKEKQIKVFDLTESNPTRAGFSYPKNEILKSLSKPESLLYQPEPFGDIKARQAVCAMYERQGFSVEPSRVILTSSSSEAYSFLFRLLLNPHEAVLFPRPSYPLFDFLAQLNDAEICPYPLVYKKTWEVDEEGLKAAVTDKTKALVLVNPNNPTGSFIKEQELFMINQVCDENHLAVICDEVFLDYAFSKETHLAKSLVDNASVLTFTLGGLSKSLGLPQMKLSWIVASGPEKEVQEALKRLEIIADTYLSVNTPSQRALSSWLLQKEKIQKQIKARIEKNKRVLSNAFSKTSLTVLHGEGGWYGILQLPQGTDEESCALNLLESHHVFVHPGYFFDFAEGAHIVLSYLTPEDVFRQGVQKIAVHLQNA